MAEIHISSLGSSEVRGHGPDTIRFRLTKTKLLMIYLAWQDGRATSREKLAYLLWGDHPATQARASLRQVLSELRKILEPLAPACLHADGEDISLEPSCIDLDALQFLRLSRLKDEASLQKAADLYRGQVLDGIDLGSAGFEDWVGQERRLFHQTATKTVYRLIDLNIDKGHRTKAIENAEKLIELDPLDEATYRKLMKLRAAEGQFHASLQLFEQCKEILLDELAIDPQSETVRLAEKIRRDRMSVRALTLSEDEIPSETSEPILSQQPARDTDAPQTQSGFLPVGRSKRPQIAMAFGTCALIVLAFASVKLANYVGLDLPPEAAVSKSVEVADLMQEGVGSEGSSAKSVQLASLPTGSTSEFISIEPAAFEAFREGQRMFDMQTPVALGEAIERFKEALELEPEFPHAYANLANAYMLSHVMHWDTALELGPNGFGLSKSVEYARDALMQDSRQALAQTVLAKAAFFGGKNDGRYEEAIAKARQAFVLDPEDSDAYMGLGQIFIYGGEPERAIAHLNIARGLSSARSGEAEYLLALAYFHMERFSDAVKSAELALEKSPDAYSTWALLAASQGYLGKKQEAILAINHARSLSRNQNIGPISTRLIPGFMAYIDPIDRARLRYGIDFACILIGAGPDG